MSNKRVNPFRLKLQMLELENDNLTHENKILAKALELACEDGDDKIHQAIGIDKNTYNWDRPSMKLEEEYIQQAEKELKDEFR